MSSPFFRWTPSRSQLMVFVPSGITSTRVPFLRKRQSRSTWSTSSLVILRFSASAALRILAAVSAALRRSAIIPGLSAQVPLRRADVSTPYFLEYFSWLILASAGAASAPSGRWHLFSSWRRTMSVSSRPLASVMVAGSSLASRNGPPVTLKSFFSKSCSRSSGLAPASSTPLMVFAFE